MASWLATPLRKLPSAAPQVFCCLHNNTNAQKTTPNSADVSPVFLLSHWEVWCCGPSTYQGIAMMMSFMYLS